MKGPELGGGNSRSQLDNQQLAAEALQTVDKALAAVAKTGNENDQKNSQDGNFDPNSVIPVDHNEVDQKGMLEKMSDAELKEYSKEAAIKFKSMTIGTPEFEEARRRVLDIAKEKNNRYRARKEQEKNTNQPEASPNPIKAPGEGEKEKLSLRERIKKTKVWKKVVSGVVAGALLIGAVGVGAKALSEMKPDTAHADSKIEQEANQSKMHEMANGIQYNYDGLFGGDSGFGYNQNKDGKWDFAPSHVLGNVWQDETGTRRALIDLVEKQPDLNGADYLCGLSDGDLNKIGMTQEHGTKLDTISEWMGSDKEFHDEATDLLRDIFNDPETVVEFGPLTNWSAAGNYVNAGGVINDESTLNDMNNVKIVGSNTQEDEHTAVIHIKTKAGSELLIKAGSFDENGQFVQEDGCAQLIWTFEAAGKVFVSVTPAPDTPTPPGPTPPGPVPPGPTPQPKGPDAHSGGEEVPLPVTPIDPSADYVEATPDNHVTGGGDTKANPDSSGPNQNHTDQELSDIWKQHQGK